MRLFENMIGMGLAKDRLRNYVSVVDVQPGRQTQAVDAVIRQVTQTPTGLDRIV